MEQYDYSIYYKNFNQTSAIFADQMARVNVERLGPLMPDDRNSRVLDIGCGWGFSLLGLRKMGFQNLEGIERCPEQARYAAENGVQVQVVEETENWLESKSGAFDVILLLDVLEHISQNQQIHFCRSIANALRPDGRLIISVPNANSLLAARWRYGDFTHWTSFTEHSLSFVLLNAGFGEVNLVLDKPMSRLPPVRIWSSDGRKALRRWLIRKAWRQAVKAELFWMDTHKIPLELNLWAVVKPKTK